MSDPTGADQASGCLVGAFMLVMVAVLIYAAIYGLGIVK